MKFSLPLLLCLALPIGCTTAPNTSQPPAAIAPGYLNATDQQLGEILSGARAFYVSIQQQSAAGKITLTPTEKTAFNAFATALNTAEAAYLSYHASPSVVTEDAASRAVQQAQTQQALLPLPGAFNEHN
jgi:hypothetical protein